MNVDEIGRLYQSEGPFVTVYLTTEGATEGAAQKVDLRWKNLRKELSELGADDKTLRIYQVTPAQTPDRLRPTPPSFMGR